MSKILILGQSVTAIKAVEQIRAVDQESEITVIGFSDGLPMLNERFPEWSARLISAENVAYKNEKFYHNLRVEFVTGHKISRINFARKTVFFDDKTKLEADIIIIADTDKDAFGGVKGATREGVFSLKRAEQVIRLQNMMGRMDTVIIEAQSLRGVMFARVLSVQNKEILFCIPSAGLMPGMLDTDISDTVITLMQQAGMRVLRNSFVKEILGDEDVKAVRLNVEKVIACEAVIFPDARPDLRLYQRGDLNIADYVTVDERLKTNYDGVFALDELTQEGAALAQFFDYDSLRARQAQRLALAITGSAESQRSTVRSTSMNIAGRELTFIGDLCPDNGEVLTLRDENGLMCMRVFLKNDVVQGAFLIDNISTGTDMCRYIQTGQVVDWEKDGFFSSTAWQKGFICPKEGEDSEVLPQDHGGVTVHPDAVLEDPDIGRDQT